MYRQSKTIMVLLVIFGGLLIVTGNCPPCIKKMFLESGERHGTTADGRRKVKVCITGSWDASPGRTDDRVWNAVVAAITEWNNAKGTNDQKIPYFFELDQSTLNNDCTLPIVKPPSVARNTCARSNIEQNLFQTPPAGAITRIDMPEATVNLINAEGLKAAFAHEFGHALGLSGVGGTDCLPDGPTTSNFSIMTAALPGCVGAYTTQVKARDVDQVRKQFADSEGNCTRLVTDALDFSPAWDWELIMITDEPYGDCYARYEVTEYYSCNGYECTYLYSNYEFLGIVCY